MVKIDCVIINICHFQDVMLDSEPFKLTTRCGTNAAHAAPDPHSKQTDLQCCLCIQKFPLTHSVANVQTPPYRKQRLSLT